MMLRRALVIALCCLPFSLHASDPEAILMLVDYVAVDYPEAVRDGEIINEFEYAEMQEFGAEIMRLVEELDGDATASNNLAFIAKELNSAIDQRTPADEISRQAARLRSTLLQLFPVRSQPRQAPDFDSAVAIYMENCASCHGTDGTGNGELAANMDPPPTDFTESERARQRNLYGLYSTISRGVEGTAMRAYGELSDHERWSLAYLVGTMHLAELDADAAAAEFEANPEQFSLQELHTKTAAELSRLYGPAVANAYAWLRVHPDELFKRANTDPLAIATAKLEQSNQAYQDGDRERALEYAIDAYLEGFELVEAALVNVAGDRARDLESRMLQLRRAIRDEESTTEIANRVSGLVVDLDEARELLNPRSMSGNVAFSSAAIILLREGLEAILILAAIAAFLQRTGRGMGMVYLHAGWIAALLLGFATWLVSSYFIAISGATRELTEGITALFAAAVLFYVGFWMHSKLSVQRWSSFIHDKVAEALNRQTLFGIAIISFVAVYREVFETVLFYQALWNQTGTNGHQMILAGFVFASVLLAIIAWLIFRAGARLPLRQFFAASAVIIFILAVIFAGKGIAAMVEAGVIPGIPVRFARIDLLGIYPELIGLIVQVLMSTIAIGVVIRQRRQLGF